MNHYTLHYFLIIWYANRRPKSRFRNFQKLLHFNMLLFCVDSLIWYVFFSIWINAYNSSIALQHTHSFVIFDLVKCLHWNYIKTNVKITCLTLISTFEHIHCELILFFFLIHFHLCYSCLYFMERNIITWNTLEIVHFVVVESQFEMFR